MPLYDSAVVKVYFVPILHLALPKLMLLCTVECSSSLSHTPHPCLQLYVLSVGYCICYCQLSQYWEVASRIELVCLFCLFADLIGINGANMTSLLHFLVQLKTITYFKLV